MAYDNSPKSIWEVGAKIKFDEPLDANDPRFVDLRLARGVNFNYNALLKPLGINPHNWELMFEPDDYRYILFCGHRGGGKSTELRRIAQRLHDPARYFTVQLDALSELDINNLQYTDVLLALAKTLLQRLQENYINIDEIFLENLQSWFDERIEKHEKTREFATEIKTEAKAGGGVPLLYSLFAGITNAFKTNSTYKEELRRVAQNHFSEFARAFNQLISAANGAVKQANKGQQVLFVIDGTDRLNQEDSQRFFVADAYQLQEVHGLFVYCTPIHLIYEQGQINQVFPHIFKLPMIKLQEKDWSRVEEGYDTLRDLIHRRAHPDLFDSRETVDTLIAASGGHPRDLLRLLSYAFNAAEGELFDRPAADKAIAQLASDYRRLLDVEDYALLKEIDQNPDKSHNAERSRKLLYDLALLEYNSYWWRSHPVIRRLPSYPQDPATAS